MTITTHIAGDRLFALCGFVFPSVNGVVTPVRGSRVGVTIGKTFSSCYIVGERDSNDQCDDCESIRKGTE